MPTITGEYHRYLSSIYEIASETPLGAQPMVKNLAKCSSQYRPDNNSIKLTNYASRLDIILRMRSTWTSTVPDPTLKYREWVRGMSYSLRPRLEGRRGLLYALGPSA